jgi:hypothetical protein
MVPSRDDPEEVAEFRSRGHVDLSADLDDDVVVPDLRGEL